MRDTYVRVQKILPPKARDEMTDEEFDAVMERGMVQASSEEGQDADTFGASDTPFFFKGNLPNLSMRHKTCH